jgi:hypothetical protein
MVANESPPVAISDWRTTGGTVDPVSTAQVFASRFPLAETTGELAQSTILKWRASRDLELAHHWRSFRCVTAGVLASPTHKKDYPMQIISHHEVLSPAIPRTLARAIRRVAQRDGIPVATVVKRLLQDALAAEGEMPGPRGNDPVLIFTRIDTGPWMAAADRLPNRPALP